METDGKQFLRVQLWTGFLVLSCLSPLPDCHEVKTTSKVIVCPASAQCSRASHEPKLPWANLSVSSLNWSSHTLFLTALPHVLASLNPSPRRIEDFPTTVKASSLGVGSSNVCIALEGSVVEQSKGYVLELSGHECTGRCDWYINRHEWELR